MVVVGRQYAISGTSASAPVVAGMISLVNAARLAVGKPSLGWINPTLYENNQYLTNDVTYGVNNCTAGTPPAICCKEGFHNTIGWDPVTGFGSINFVAFKDFFLSIGDVAPHPLHSASPTPHPTSKTFAPTSKLTVLPVPDTILPTRVPTILPTAIRTAPRPPLFGFPPRSLVPNTTPAPIYVIPKGLAKNPKGNPFLKVKKGQKDNKKGGKGKGKGKFL